jgi:hypothetical protein
MHDALVGLLDKVDAAVAESAESLDSSEVEAVASLARDTRMRISYPESTVVVALCGGTGSGKSSLLNAIAGEELALTGGIRPMTSVPLALVPASGAEALTGYLDALEIEDRVEHQGPPWLCLLDLPDNDSVEVAHRHRVDSLLSRVDMVIWVTDPEKYRDASLHHGYIAPMSRYQDQFLFVLNQVDRVGRSDAALIAEDLARALEEDGIRDPKVITTAASPVAGPAIGIDELVGALEEVVGKRETVNRKSLVDLAAASARLVGSSAPAQAVDFERQWAAVVASAVDLAVGGRAAGGGHELAEYVTQLAGAMGGGTGERLGDLALETNGAFLRCVAAQAPPGERLPLRSRFGRGTPPDPGLDPVALSAAVDVEIGEPIRELLVQRGRAHAAITDLALALGDLERKGG